MSELPPRILRAEAVGQDAIAARLERLVAMWDQVLDEEANEREHLMLQERKHLIRSEHERLLLKSGGQT